MSHTYAYKLRLRRTHHRIGDIYTGRLKTGRPYSDAEVHRLAVEMSNGIALGSTLVEVKEVFG